MKDVKEGSWLHDLIEVYNELGGQAPYGEVYPIIRARRLKRGASWTPKSEQTIQGIVEQHAESSKKFKGRAVFYSVYGHGRGVWALMPDYLITSLLSHTEQTSAYSEGMEGIVKEQYYLQRSRDPRLVQARKEIDAFSCQACGFYLPIGKDKYIIDVHHLNPLGNLDQAAITSVNDLVCLCPTCHRIAHSRPNQPLSLSEIKKSLLNAKYHVSDATRKFTITE